MIKHIVYGAGVKTKTFSNFNSAKSYLQKSRKSYRIMGLCGYIDSYYDNGKIVKRKYHTFSNDKTYKLSLAKKQTGRAWRKR